MSSRLTGCLNRREKSSRGRLIRYDHKQFDRVKPSIAPGPMIVESSERYSLVNLILEDNETLLTSLCSLG